MESISWKLIDKYFNDNVGCLISHHLESYNEFFNSGLHKIFKENNPIRFLEPDSSESKGNKECLLYLGGKDGNKIYYGKPIIYDDNQTHFMFPNDARLRDMTYGITIHYDVDVDIIFNHKTEEEKIETLTLEKIYLGKFPIMLKSKLCVLNDLAPEVCYNMGECKVDKGGYFIIDGKEKTIIPQETFADNMLYVRKYKEGENYLYSSEIRSVSEDTSKPVRTTSVKMMSPSATHSNKQIVVEVPNVRKPIPLFILMRALGVISDKEIIESCILDLELNERYIDLFIPSVHDACKIFTQQSALEFIATFTKRQSVSYVMDILMNYFIPHVGINNFLDKAFFIGHMTMKLLRVHTGEEKPTDRDNFKYKRVEQAGKLLYDLFREYYLIQQRSIFLAIDKEYFFHIGEYKSDETFSNLIENNYREFFKTRDVETGIKKAFKGNWGALSYTKKLGVVQDANRLSGNSFISQLRKLNLPLDASAKVVGPRHLNGSQWGFIDPVDTPDGGNIGLHKHLSIITHITSGSSSYPIIQWIRSHTPMKLLQECPKPLLAKQSKVIVNGNWIGVIAEPLETMNLMKNLKRNGTLPIYISISFDYQANELYIYTDGGRLMRPLYYIDDGKPSYDRAEMVTKLNEGKLSWQDIVSGFKEKQDPLFSIKSYKIYSINDLYGNEKIDLKKYGAMVDYVDAAEEDVSLIATTEDQLKEKKSFTHIEIHPSLLLGVMGNLIIYPEHNPYARNAFSCGQSKQAVSVFHTNFQNRIDKMSVILNNGQVPLLKSRYLHLINEEKQPYGVNAIVAIMSYTGYNVEDAILINKGAVDRGIFRTTYYTSYSSREESQKVSGSTSNSYFTDVSKKNVAGLKKGYDYNYFDENGIIREGTKLNDKIMLIGKVTSGEDSEMETDQSIKPKKGQLGVVDKSFMTDGEEGFRIAKVRIREERIPAIGDKMASRAGQKGTIGLIIPEENMPFSSDGLKPDLIINPHAIPSRMTIGQLIESLFGKACCEYGGFGDCTAYTTQGPNVKTYGKMLTKVGFHSSGNEILYSGMDGRPLSSEIFIGPTYYMRLKHMVKDKINHRARGPNNQLTRQSVHGRANDGGLRIGEMERDGVVSHGMAHFLSESFLERADEYYMAVCNQSGMIAVYNVNENIFMSPQVDGPIQFHTTLDDKLNVKQISKHGRSFSIVRIPYSFKLLIQELQVMNVQFRIITEENVNNLLSMTYSGNIIKLTQDKIQFEGELTSEKIQNHVEKYKRMTDKLNYQLANKGDNTIIKKISKESSTPYNPLGSESGEKTETGDSSDIPPSPTAPPDQPNQISESPQYLLASKDDSSTPYNPLGSESTNTNTNIEFEPKSPDFPPPPKEGEIDPSSKPSKFNDEKLDTIYNTMSSQNKDEIDKLPKEEQKDILKRVEAKRGDRDPEEDKKKTAILEIEEKEEKSENDEDDDETNDSNSGSTSAPSGALKKVDFSIE